MVVDFRRRRLGPSELIKKLRAMGASRKGRNAAGRDRLRRFIRFVDSYFPSGPNCYRRALIEIALDSGAAAERLHLGLQRHGTPFSGHAWLASSPDRGGTYDAEFVV